MLNHESDPREVAARYRVKKDEEGKFELCSDQGSPENLKRDYTSISFQTTLNAVGWHATYYAMYGSEETYFIDLLVAELNIGYTSDEGWSHSNALVDNCFFVIDGEALRYLPLTQLRVRVLSEEQFNARKSWLAAEKGEKLTPNTKDDDDSTPLIGRSTIVHCPAGYGDDYGRDESLECTIGLSQTHYERLLDGCLNQRISGVYFSGYGGALSSGSDYPPGVARDLILLAGEGFDISIDSLTVNCRVEPESQPVKSEEELVEVPRSPSETEWQILVALERIISGIGTLRSTVIKTSWILAVALIIVALILSSNQ